ncbi:MAG: UDP-N-acetylmuramate--L-alanine ligase [Pseudomonadota bacterium]
MTDRMRKIHALHFVGIGGAGMSGIAEVLINLGYEISGSDLKSSGTTDELTRLGAKIQFGHHASHGEGADVIVVSSAVDHNNPEVVAAKENRIPVVPRAEMLSELMRFRHGIAVAGTHGKTTTTSLVASILAEGGMDPTFVIGGRLNSIGGNAKLGSGKYLVAEADESDASFLHLQPMLSVITNIDKDHLSTYDQSFEKLKRTFVEFLHNMPFYGLAVVCIDDPGVRSIVGEVNRSFLSYGLGSDADLRAVNLDVDANISRFTVVRHGHADMQVELNLPGEHNVRNALAAIGVAQELEIDDAVVCKALSEFQGIGRRFQVLGDIDLADGSVLLVDDYGHHPTEVGAAIQAARAGWPDRRLLVVFQPHRFTRTRDLLDDFADVLSSVDVLLLAEVYSAGEQPIEGADGRAIARSIRKRGRVEPIFIENIDTLADDLLPVVRPGDLVLMLGAGNIGAVAESLPEQLREKVAS